MALDLLIATLEIRSQWSNASRMKANSFKPKILYPTKLTTKCEGRVKIFFRHIMSEKDYLSCTISQKKHSNKTKGKCRVKEAEGISLES